MPIIIAAAGRMRAGPERELMERYLTRLPWKIAVREVEEKKPLPPAALKEREAELLLDAVPERSLIIILDERGKILSSQDFAAKLAGWLEERGTVSFLIGGAGGHGENVKEAADFSLSLGAMTWPHMLARVMLAEQLYRAHSIISGHPYHRE